LLPNTSLQLLAKVLREESSVVLIQARADAGLSKNATQKLADQRSGAIKFALVAMGVPAERLFTAADGSASPGSPLASVLRIQ
jgi:outer membrane protein OmpA-like peptidoglycan-associated protein